MRFRFIPARAGNTPGGRRNVRAGTVHPRACGEHVACQPAVACWCGSSPRVRGTHYLLFQREGIARFIPARAGNTA